MNIKRNVKPRVLRQSVPSAFDDGVLFAKTTRPAPGELALSSEVSYEGHVYDAVNKVGLRIDLDGTVTYRKIVAWSRPNELGNAYPRLHRSEGMAWGTASLELFATRNADNEVGVLTITPEKTIQAKYEAKGLPKVQMFALKAVKGRDVTYFVTKPPYKSDVEANKAAKIREQVLERIDYRETLATVNAW